MEEAKQWNMSPNEMQTTFYIVNVSPSVSIDDAIAVIIGILNNDIDELRKQTNFIFDNKQASKYLISNCHKNKTMKKIYIYIYMYIYIHTCFPNSKIY